MEKKIVNIGINSLEVRPDLNPRTTVGDVEELAASITALGVLEPLLVRAKGKPSPDFEIISGNRRFEAAKKASLNAVPCIIMEATDEQFRALSIVENIHRLDLTDYEEAQAYWNYAKGRGGDKVWKDAALRKPAVTEIAERTGKSKAYVSRRIAIFAELPTEAEVLWQSGKATFTHLVHLLRIAGTEAMGEAVKGIKNGRFGSAEDLDEWISNLELPLTAARFDTGCCKACAFNSAAQRELFDIKSKKASCMRPSCFETMTAVWAKEHWKTSPEGKKLGTNNLLPYANEKMRGSFNIEDPFEKCADCAGFVSFYRPGDGRIAVAQACAGDASCYNRLLKERAAAVKAKTAGEKKAAKKEGGKAEPRAPWHGEWALQTFLRRQIGGVFDHSLKEKPMDQRSINKIASALLIVNNSAAKEAARKYFRKKNYMGDEDLVALVMDAVEPGVILQTVMREAVIEGEYKGAWDNGKFPGDCRAMVAKELGIDALKEWAPDAEYLQRKTRLEVVSYIKKHKLDKDAIFKHELAAAKIKTIDGAPKGKLTGVLIAYQKRMTLAGKLTAEVEAAAKGKKR